MVRKVDELGRIVLPAELRQAMDINVKDPIEIFTDGDCIVLKKYQQACVFCNEAEGLTLFGEKRICSSCLKRIKNEL